MPIKRRRRKEASPPPNKPLHRIGGKRHPPPGELHVERSEMSKSIERNGRLIAVAIGLALVAFMPRIAIAAVTLKPGLPEVLTFRLEDGRHRTPGLTLSFALPGILDYECRQIVFREDRRDQDITITLLGVAPAKNYGNCLMVKVPSPIRERIVLPPEHGNYRIVFASGERRDAYALAVTRDTVALEAEGSPTFTTCEQTGKHMRVGPHWLWVDFSFLTDQSSRKMSTKRDEVLSALAAIGAKAFAPPPGRYLLDGFVRQIPCGMRSNGDAREEHFFLWNGDWEDLRTLANRYRKYAKVANKHPVMILWLSSRDNVVSTSGGYLNSSIQQKSPPNVQDGVPPNGRAPSEPANR